jgi:hypothetical protein
MVAGGGFGWGFAIGFGAPSYGGYYGGPYYAYGRLCHASPLGDQSLRSSRLAVDSRLLLEAPFAILGRPPARGASVACQPSGVT